MARARSLVDLDDEELDAEHMAVQAERAKAEAEFKAKALEIQRERDVRQLAAVVATVPDEVKAAILAEAEG